MTSNEAEFLTCIYRNRMKINERDFHEKSICGGKHDNMTTTSLLRVNLI